MRLRDFLDPTAIALDLAASTRDDALAELVALLGVPERAQETIVRQLLRREMLGSTGFGGGIAIPHCRTLAVTRLRVAFGRHQSGLSWGAIDGHPVHLVFLIVAPPAEMSNQYLPVLGRVAQLGHDPQVTRALREVKTPEECWDLLDQRGV